jgi:GH24 family phage-related lysozyme (muramidase)
LVIPEEERVGKASGGLIKGKDDVPFTKEDPADRINPYTGKSYAEDREPFAVGGFIKSVLSSIDANKLKKVKDIPESKPVDTRPEAYRLLDLDDDAVETWKNERKREVDLKEADTGLPQKRKQVDEVLYAAKDLKNGAIDVFEYRDVVEKFMPVVPFEKVPPITPIKEIAQALKADQVKKGIVGLNKTFKEGDKLSLRLDIPAYDNYDSWIVTIHDGTKRSGSPLAYAQTGWIKNVEFKTVPTAAFSIATKKSPKGTIARMHGNWKEHNSEQAHAFVTEKLNSKEWTQIGMNPYRYSYFYDKADQMPVVAADEVIQVGPLVIAKNVTKASPDDEMFMAFSKKDNKRFKFAAGGSIDAIPEEEIIYKMVDEDEEERVGFQEGGAIQEVYKLATDQDMLNFILATEDAKLYKDYRDGNLDKVYQAHEGSKRFQEQHGRKDVSTLGGVTNSGVTSATVAETVKLVQDRLKLLEKEYNNLVPVQVRKDTPHNKQQALFSLLFNNGATEVGKSKALQGFITGDMDKFYKEAFDPVIGFVNITGADGKPRPDQGLINRRQQEKQLAEGTWQDPYATIY